MALIRIMGEAAGVMLLALTLAAASLIFRPALRPLITDTSRPESRSQPSADNKAPSITLEDARSFFQTGKALFADARSFKAYQMGHIQGAMNLDPAEFETWSETFFSQFPADTLIIAYCDGTQCPLSSELAEKLIQMGYGKVFVLKNGWGLWRAAQLPTEQVAQ